MLKIHETTTPAGELSSVHLFFDAGALMLRAEGSEYVLPDGALEATLARFGKPLDPEQPLVRVAELELGSGLRLAHVRHLARYDVIARDYLVLEIAGSERVCALAATVAAALLHLGRAASMPR
jgi:hypothetical protein